MSKESESQTSARIDQKTKKLIIKLKGKLSNEIGQELSNNDAIYAAVKMALDDYEKRKKQLKLNL